MIAGTLRRLGLDENLISGIRALADAVIVTDEEEGKAAWPKADQGDGSAGGEAAPVAF